MMLPVSEMEKKMNNQTFNRAKAYRGDLCLYCAEPLGFGNPHICPAGCCYVAASGDPAQVTCPYCYVTFTVGIGHVCPEVLIMTIPQQEDLPLYRNWRSHG